MPRYTVSTSWEPEAPKPVPPVQFASHFLAEEPEAKRWMRRLWMRQFGWMALLVAATSLLWYPDSLMLAYWSLGGMLLALVVSRFVADLQLRLKPAEMRFQGNAFYYLSLYDLAYQAHNVKPFPASYANPAPFDGRLRVHFHDRVIDLHDRDWPNLEEVFREMLQRQRV